MASEIKTILVHVDTAKRSERALETALMLADRHDAHLIGLGVRSPATMPSYAAVEIPQEVIEQIVQEQNRAVEEAEEKFQAAVKRSGRDARCEWRAVKGILAEAIVDAGRGADLVVIGQEEEEDTSLYEGVPDQVVLEAGRPVLVVPYFGQTEKIGSRIVVAWNDSREAARAVSDAMPFLKAADDVEVVTVGDGDGESVPGEEAGRFLAAHGISARLSSAPAGSIGAENVLLNRVSDDGANLIVMGAYGHSRLREMVLGGMTRHILRHMTAPVLMSH